jgi:hypothetical protein
MKKTIIFNALFLIVFLFSKQLLLADDFIHSYEISDDGQSVIIDRVSWRTTGEVIIPEEIEGKKVRTIAYQCFADCSRVTKIILPDTITSIERNAFFRCGRITEINLPKSLKTIGDGAFTFCSGLTNLVIPDEVTSIGEQAFNGCSFLETITFGQSLTTLPYDVFRFCENLNEIIFKGDAPTLLKRERGQAEAEETSTFENWGTSESATVIAKRSATGFGTSFGGLPVKYIDMNNPIRPSFQSQFSRIDSTRVAFSFPSEIGKKYTIQTSSDLINWDPLETNISGTGDIIERKYSNQQKQQFFKLLQVEGFNPDFIRTINFRSGAQSIDLQFGFSPSAKDGRDEMDIASPSKVQGRFWAEWVDAEGTYSKQVFEGTPNDTEEHVFRLKLPNDPLTISWDNLAMSEVFTSMTIDNNAWWDSGGPRNLNMLVSNRFNLGRPQLDVDPDRELVIRVTPKNTLITSPEVQGTTFNLLWEGGGRSINGKLTFPTDLESMDDLPGWGEFGTPSTISGGQFTVTIDGNTTVIENPSIYFYKGGNAKFDYSKELIGQGGFGPQNPSRFYGDFNIFNAGAVFSPVNFFTIRDTRGFTYTLRSMKVDQQ